MFPEFCLFSPLRYEMPQLRISFCDDQVEQRTIRQTSEIKFLNRMVEKHGLAEAPILVCGILCKFLL